MRIAKFSVIASLALAAAAAAPSAYAAAWFGPYVRTDIANGNGPGPAPRGTASADFNRDGKPDLATITEGGTNGVILFAPGNGNGTFGTPSPLPDTTGVQGLDAGDVNGDGKPDVVGATTSELRVRLGDGAGGFSVAGTYPLTLGGQVEPLLVDLDNDNDLDVVAPTFTAIQTLINSGAGSFTAGPTSQVTGSCTLSAISIAKLNSGTTPDLFATDGCSGATYALLGNGSGGFNVSGTLYGAGFVPEDVTAIDLDGDGCDDAATVGSFSFTLATGLTNCSGAFRTSTAQSTQYGGAGPTSATAGDFNRDGRMDLAVSSLASMNPTLKVLAGNGTASMQLVGDFAVASLPQNPVLADYNGDGKLDIVTAGPGAVSFLPNITT